uniref:Uncharacterized protein n=1 Tax=Anguilla anguilla TaxID=7936 RepID=A0A0E9UUG6_ANGAN
MHFHHMYYMYTHTHKLSYIHTDRFIL